MHSGLAESFPQVWWKSLGISCEKTCELVSTILTFMVRYGVILWKSRDGGKVLHSFYIVICTGKMGDFPLLGGKFCTVST